MRREAFLSSGEFRLTSTHIHLSMKAYFSRYRGAAQGTNEEQEDDEDKEEDPEELQKQRAMDDWKDGMYSYRYHEAILFFFYFIFFFHLRNFTLYVQKGIFYFNVFFRSSSWMGKQRKHGLKGSSVDYS